MNRLDSSLLTPEQNHRVFQEIKKLNKKLSVEELEKAEQQIMEKLLIEFKN